jgi:vanadium chloroperoxidase
MMDSILFWNAVALEANRISHSDPDKREQNGPTLSSRALAIVHLAMYDAYAGVKNNPNPDLVFPRYLPAPPPPVGAISLPDAVAGAAYWTLKELFKTQKDFFDAQLSAFNHNTPLAPGDPLITSFDFGVAVGRAMLAERAADPGAGDNGYMVHNGRCRHRVDPDNPGQGYHAPYYGAQSKGFAISVRHKLDRPPCDNADYLTALRQVRAKGIKPELMATLPNALFDDRRNGLETLIGIYWGYDGSNRLGTPPRQYNQIIRIVAMNTVNLGGNINDEGENAKLFAFVNAAMGDAGILAWEQKYCHDFWRPVVGIREHDENLGPSAPHAGVGVNFNDGDSGWLPLGSPNTNSLGMKNFTPNFPAYPSGHATFGAAAFHITRMFYGIAANDKNDDQLFPGFFVSDEFNGGNRDNNGTVRPRHTRFFPGGLWDMIIENATSRVLLGVHWIFDAFDFNEDDDGNLVPDLGNENIGGVGLGLRIARDIFAHGSDIAPKMTPNSPAVNPPIETPPANSPMPTVPAQPASVGHCADAPVARTRKKATDKKAREEAEEKQKVEIPYPSGISQR